LPKSHISLFSLHGLGQHSKWVGKCYLIRLKRVMSSHFRTCSAQFVSAMSLLIALLPGMPDVVRADEDIRPFDHVIERIDRLEFYRLADFGSPDSACYPCQIAQHVKCDQSCYAEIPSVSLICTQKIRGLSIGPFDREERARILGELFKTDTIFITTTVGDEPLEAPRVASIAGDEDNDYAIDIEGLEGFKNTLIRASTSPEQFSVTVGSERYTIPLSYKVKDGLYRFLKQCPD
jgi:hypothetical protein